MFEFLVCT